MKYRLIDHTADFGIHVFGADIKELYENAAFAMFDLITDLQMVKGVRQQQIEVVGEDPPDLMVNWLRELLYLWTGKEMLIQSAQIESVSDFALSAIVTYEPYDPARHVIREEIKAVTYHQVDVRRGSTGWESKIILDV